MEPSAEQLIRDYLNQLSVAARTRLRSDERRAFLARTRLFIERTSGGSRTADPAAVASTLASLGDPAQAAERERARLAAERSERASAGTRSGLLRRPRRRDDAPDAEAGPPAGDQGAEPSAPMPQISRQAADGRVREEKEPVDRLSLAAGPAHAAAHPPRSRSAAAEGRVTAVYAGPVTGRRGTRRAGPGQCGTRRARPDPAQARMEPGGQTPARNPRPGPGQCGTRRPGPGRGESGRPEAGRTGRRLGRRGTCARWRGDLAAG